MRTILSTVVVLGLASLAAAQTTAKPNATVTLKSLVESRELTLEKSTFSGWKNGIELSLHIDGPAVQGARKYGRLKATEAIDDAGTDLLKKGEGPDFESTSFDEIREPQTFGSGFGNKKEEPKPTGFDVTLKLPTPAARSAKTIKSVIGSIEVLVGGEKKIVSVKPLKSNLGKTIDDPALKSLGVTVELVDPAKGGARRRVASAQLFAVATRARASPRKSAATWTPSPRSPSSTPPARSSTTARCGTTRPACARLPTTSSNRCPPMRRCNWKSGRDRRPSPCRSN